MLRKSMQKIRTVSVTDQSYDDSPLLLAQSIALLGQPSSALTHSDMNPTKEQAIDYMQSTHTVKI